MAMVRGAGATDLVRGPDALGLAGVRLMPR